MKRETILSAAAKGLWALMCLALLMVVVQGARLGVFPSWAVALAAAIAAGLGAWLGWLVWRPSKDTRYTTRTRRYTGPIVAAAVIAALCLIGFHVESIAKSAGDAVFTSDKAAGASVSAPFTLAIATNQGVGENGMYAFAAVNPETKQIEAVSVPNTALVDDGAGGTAPLNSLSFSAAVSAMEKVFGIQAGHRLRLSTEGLKTTVDELGGIRVTSSETFTSGGHTFTVGTNHLSGSEALAFGARSSANQLLVLDAVMRKMASEEVLTHYSTVMAGLGRTIKTDFSAKQFAQLAKSASGWQTTTYAVTGTATGSGTALDADTAAAAKSRLESVLKGN
jgi:anionic cell wall polymer biosynthesis LytR-Cps2A-Psr (LCP) family protein